MSVWQGWRQALVHSVQTISTFTCLVNYSCAYPQIGSGPCRETLLNLTEFKELVSLDQPTQLSDQRNVLADVPAELAELGVLFHKTFHVADGVNRRWVVRKRVRLV